MNYSKACKFAFQLQSKLKGLIWSLLVKRNRQKMEVTGLSSKEDAFSALDTPSERFQKARNAGTKFMLIQVKEIDV